MGIRPQLPQTLLPMSLTETVSSETNDQHCSTAGAIEVQVMPGSAARVTLSGFLDVPLELFYGVRLQSG